MDNEGIKLTPTKPELLEQGSVGYVAAHIKNMIEGVTTGFKRICRLKVSDTRHRSPVIR